MSLSISRFEVPTGRYYASVDDMPAEAVSVARLCLAAAGQDRGEGRDDTFLLGAMLGGLDTASVYVVRRPGARRVVGMAAYHPYDTSSDAVDNTSRLDMLAVDQDARGQGIGNYLINHLVDVAQEGGVEAIRVRSRAYEPTVRFYLNNGFYLEEPHLPLSAMPKMRRDI